MEIFLSAELRPFSIIAGITLVLALFEVLLMVLGLSSGDDGEGADFDLDAEGMESGIQPADLDLFSADEIASLDLPRDERAEMLRPRPSRRRAILSSIGIGNGPLLVALSCMSACVSALGFALQAALDSLLGFMLPGVVALLIVLIPGLRMAGGMTRWLSRLIPTFESQAISAKTYNGRHGVVVTGTARAGYPAQVRWYDLYGTMHNIMAEPFRETDAIPEGTKVLLVRTRQMQPRIVARAEGPKQLASY